jgi:hypothetical protein
MFNKKLKEEIEVLREEIEGLRRDFWRSQYPYGEVRAGYGYSPLYARVYYKPDYDTNICLDDVFRFPCIKYSIKTIKDKTYLVLEYQKRENAEPVDVKQTFIIKNGVAVELDKEVALDSFDTTGTI